MLIMISTASASVIDQIKADMGLNEAPLMNTTRTTSWAKAAYISMGKVPRGDATPYWWTPSNPSLKTNEYWDVITPWFVIYPAEGHSARNVRVKVSSVTAYVMLKNGTFKQLNIQGDGKPKWYMNFKFDLGGDIGKTSPRIEADGQLSFKLTDAFNPIHGTIERIDLLKNGINPSDIESIVVSAKTQLITDNPAGIDDRANAKILFSVGADYYPELSTNITDFAPMTYVPAVGASRYGFVKSEVRTHYMSTIDPPTVGRISAYIAAGGSVTTPFDRFKSAICAISLPGVC